MQRLPITLSPGRCAGLRHGVHEARVLTKELCCLPRHPADPVPRRLAQAPNGTETLAELRRCHATLTAAQVAQTAGGGDLTLPADISRIIADHPAASVSVNRWDALVEALADMSWPADGRRIVQQSLIARGGAKALQLWSHLQRLETLLRTLADTVSTATQCLAVVVAAPLEPRHTLPAEKHAVWLTCHQDVLVDTARWCRAIGENPTQRHFVAGDSRALGRSFPADYRPFHLVSQLRRDLHSITQQTAADLVAAEGLTPAPDGVKCNTCRLHFSHLWLTRGVCLSCQHLARTRLICPFTTKHDASAICPHTAMCFICDELSCDRCYIWRLNGEATAAMVHAMVETEQGPTFIAIDFDQTLCDTKYGNAPVVGRHTLDPELVGMFQLVAEVHVVTRNGHHDAITAFLEANGVTVTSVCCVNREKTTKVDVVCGLLARCSRVVFVDDDIREVAADVRLADPRISRVFFTNAVDC